MDADSLIQVFVAIAFVVFWLVGSGQKKKRPPASVPRRTDQTDPSTGRVDTERLIMEALGLAEAVSAPKELSMLSESSDESSEVAQFRPEAQSLEVESSLAEQEQRHIAFHRRYVERPARKQKEKISGREMLRLGGPSIRQAIVWREILGPPKGLE